jgi:hypothetical protein
MSKDTSADMVDDETWKNNHEKDHVVPMKYEAQSNQINTDYASLIYVD